MMLWITSCGKDTPPSGNGGQIWIPEFLPLEIGEDSYPNIAFAGDTLYYISYQQQAEGFRYRLSSYSPTQGSLPDLALSWPEGGDRFVTSLFAMDEESAFYLISYVTEEEGSRTHLCKFDAKGSLVYDTAITGTDIFNFSDNLCADAMIFPLWRNFLKAFGCHLNVIIARRHGKNFHNKSLHFF